MLINSPNISGSLTVTGNIIATGSLTVGGTITGTVAGTTATASYVEYTNVANKPALVSSSAQVAGYNIFATTGSNQFNGSQAITGSLTTTGTIVAQTLNVQQVTSSIVYSSGSNIFGNSVSNTQQFTGSVGVTGSLTVAGASTFSNSVTAGNNYLVNNLSATKKGYTYQSPASNWGPQVSGLYFTPNNAVDAQTTFTVELWNGVGSIITPLTIADTGAATFSSTVRTGGVSIGVASTSNILDVRGENNTFDGTIVVGARGVLQHRDAGNTITSLANDYNSDSAKIEFRMKGNTTSNAKMTILGSGNVGIDTASPNRKLEINTNNLSTADGIRINFAANNTSEGMDITYLTVGSTTTSFDSLYNSDSSVMRFRMKTAATPVTAMTILGSGNIGIGTASPSAAAGLAFVLNSGANQGRICIKTSATGDASGDGLQIGMAGLAAFIEQRENADLTFATNATERMRITSTGRVMIGGSSGTLDPVWQGMSVHGVDGTDKVIIGYLSSATNGAVIGAHISGLDNWANLNYVATNHIFRSESQTERMRITSEGNIRLFITPALDSKIEWYQTPTGNLVQARIWTDGNPRFNVQVGGSGGVYLASGATSWTAASDETLKNINSIIGNAIDKLNTLRAVNFSWKSDTSNKENLGLIAQDVEAVFPQLVDTGKDGIMGVRYTELIPVLVKAIQELKAENNTLKSRIDTLEQA